MFLRAVVCLPHVPSIQSILCFVTEVCFYLHGASTSPSLIVRHTRIVYFMWYDWNFAHVVFALSTDRNCLLHYLAVVPFGNLSLTKTALLVMLPPCQSKVQLQVVPQFFNCKARVLVLAVTISTALLF